MEQNTVDQQLALEHQCAAGGVAKYRERLHRFRTKGLESLGDPEMYLIRTMIDPVSRGIIDFIRESRRKPGRSASASVAFAAADDADALALIALRVVMSGLSRDRSIQSVALAIGNHVESHMRLCAFEQQNKPLYQRMDRHVQSSPLNYKPDYRKRVMMHACELYKVTWEKWEEHLKLHVGMALLNIIVDKTGMVQVEMSETRQKRFGSSVYVLKQTEMLRQWIDNQHRNCELMEPNRLPMLCPAKPYETLNDGGYLTPELRRPLYRPCGGMREDLTRDECPIPFDAVNLLGTVPWRINKRVLDVVQFLWDSGSSIPCAAVRTDPPLLEKPTSTDIGVISEWKFRNREIMFARLRNSGQRLLAVQILSVCRTLGDRTLYYPHNLDFRGRVYATPQYLTPQGSDLAKGLLRFERALPLGKGGLRWLKIHAANCAGVDKVSIDERLAWVDENIERVLRVGRAPLDNMRDWWDIKDTAVQFLAACIELAQAIDSGDPEHYKSTLPVTVDGSCNGIQHLSALSQDEVAGSMVNLVPKEKPADIYNAVALETTRLVGEILQDPKLTAAVAGHDADSNVGGVVGAAFEELQMASTWLRYGIKRGCAKRPTMIMPYGGTVRAVEEYISQWVDENTRTGVAHPWGRRKRTACRWLAKIMWRAMGNVVAGPRAVMEWTRKLAGAASKHQLPVRWTTPSGWRVTQAYPSVTSRRVETKLGDKVTKLMMYSDSPKIDSRRQAQGLAPNWIHSLDAAMLHILVVELFRECGIEDVMVVHDSFGAHAGSMDLLSSRLRDVFVRMYSSDDVMARFVADVTEGGRVVVDPPPAKGTLNLECVRDSVYAFA
jgi:DNA-directed RNA polymerase